MSFPFAQLLANSLIIGSIYALVACGFSLIYSTNRFVHFAHGGVIASAAYAAYFVSVKLSAPLWLGILSAVFFGVLLGTALFHLVYVPLQKRNSSSVILLIASVALLLLIEDSIQLLFGADVKSFRNTGVGLTVNILGATVTWLQIVILLVVLCLLAFLWWLMKRTRLGIQLRAVADNKQLADITGINSRRVGLIAFAIGSALAGIAGVLIGLEQNLEPAMGTHLMVKGFTGAIIGGVTSVPASILGSFLLGAAENFGIWWLPSGYKDAIAFGLLFVFLLFKPTGLLGINKGVRK